MIKAELRNGDGLSRGRSWLRSVVKNAQAGLMDAGRALEADGMFGDGTERELRAYQAANGLEADGVVGTGTWTALEPHLEASLGQHQQAVAEHLQRFEGDLDWVHEREGHEGKPYWPEGDSGVTLDPGVDLGQVSAELFESLYAQVLTPAEMRILESVLGLQRQPAAEALKTVPGLLDISITREQAYDVMPFAARTYWNSIVNRFDATANQDTPPSVQTVMLSLAYNRGPFNNDLEPLGDLLQNGDWSAIANAVGVMQQDHDLEGIRVRRRDEANLIRAELEFLG